jgi:hypothetical protein
VEQVRLGLGNVIGLGNVSGSPGLGEGTQPGDRSFCPDVIARYHLLTPMSL